jgi:hypothetical protein
MGLERRTDDGYRRVESLTLAPGRSVELTVRLSVIGLVGDPMKTAIFFRTNDPQHPEYAISVVVPVITGGVRADPRTVSFGSVPVGEPCEQVVDLYDYAVVPRTVKAVTASPVELITAELLPAGPPPPASDE